MPVASVNNINIHYEITGQGEPLLLIMGLGGDSTHWGLQLPVLSQHYQVITFDNRGVGRSDAPSGGYSIDVMAQDAQLLLEYLNIPAAHVLGFSMGGYIAQHLALQCPGKIKSLILSHTAAHSPQRTRYLMAMAAEMVNADISHELRVRAILPWMFSDDFIAHETQFNHLIELALRPLYPQSKQGYLGQVLAIRDHDTKDRIHELTMPILLLTSPDDLIIPSKEVQALQQALPQAQFHMLTHGGHCSYIENAMGYNHAVLDFLATLPLK
jgi:pimeloyl-ACP methyl ester carboxylesterase